MTAKDVAINLIEAYVKRGDSIESLRSGQQGMGGGIGSASISGYIGDKKYNSHFIVVSRIGDYKDGTPVEAVFKLEDLYNEIKDDRKQLTLL